MSKARTTNVDPKLEHWMTLGQRVDAKLREARRKDGQVRVEVYGARGKERVIIMAES